MKKIKLIVITIILFIVSLVATAYIYKPIFIAKTTATVASKADFSFAVLGDIHKNIDNFQKAIKDLNTINSAMDVLVLNGDTVDQGIKEQYDLVEKALRKNKTLLPEKIIKNIGNHEFFDYDVGINSAEHVQSSINKYLEFSGEEKVYHDTWIKNYHFISLGSEDGSSETLDALSAFISDEQLKWFKDKLGENYEKGKPIFVFLHQPLDYGYRDGRGVKQSEQIRKMLEQYPEAILFSSHTHRDLSEASIVLNQPFTMIQTGAIDYTIIPDPNSEGGRRKEAYINGLYIEVNGNNVVVKGRNFKDKQWIFSKEIN